MNKAKLVLVGFALFMCVVLKVMRVDVEPVPKAVVKAPTSLLTPRTIIKRPAPALRGVRAFMQHMGRVESDGNYKVVNRFGMLGKYQFAPGTLRSLGIHVSREEYLNNPALQDSAMRQYMRANRAELRKIIRAYVGQTVNGVRVTESGILAAAHLAGTMGVLTFFHPERYSAIMKDANGTTVAMYMQKFAGYNLRGL